MFQKTNKFLIIGALVLIVFLTLFPRSVEVLNSNPVFGFDQGREMLAAKNIVINHKLILIGTEIGAGVSGISGIFQGPVYYYILCIPFILFNGNPLGAVWLMLFFGLTSIIFGYFFGSKVLNKKGGLLVAFLMSISPILIAQSRFMWSPYPVTLFILVSLYFTFLLKKRNLNIFLAAFFAGFVYNFELAVAVPLSLSLLLFTIWIFRKELNKYLYLFAGFALSYSPMILFEIRHGFLGLKGLVTYLLTPGKTYGQPLFSLIPDHIVAIINNFKDTFPFNNFYLSFIFILCLFSLSIYYLKKEKNGEVKNFNLFLLFLVPVNLFVFLFLRNTVWTYYLTDLSLAYIFLTSYVLFNIFKANKLYAKIILILVLGFMIVLGLKNSITTSIYDYSDYGGTAKLKGKIDAIDYVYKDAKGKPFGFFAFAPAIYTYPYDYLLWWYGEKKYGYVPYQDKRGTFYLLIEKDNSKPWSYKGWLETVIKTGTIEKTITLPSGFIVQKRYVNE